MLRPLLCLFLLVASLSVPQTARAECSEFRDSTSRYFCLAMSRKSSSWCANIRFRDVRLFCQALATDNPRYCSSIDIDDIRVKCRASTRINTPGRGTHDSDCGNLDTEDGRAYCRAMRAGDEYMCGNIDSEDTRHYCKAMLTGNKAECSSIDAYDARVRCHSLAQYARSTTMVRSTPASADHAFSSIKPLLDAHLKNLAQYEAFAAGEARRTVAEDARDEAASRRSDEAAAGRDDDAESRSVVRRGSDDDDDGDDDGDDDRRASGSREPASSVAARGSEEEAEEEELDTGDLPVTWEMFLDRRVLPNRSCGEYEHERAMWLTCEAMRRHGDSGASYCRKINLASERPIQAFCLAVVSDDHEPGCDAFGALGRRIGTVSPYVATKVCIEWGRRHR